MTTIGEGKVVRQAESGCYSTGYYRRMTFLYVKVGEREYEFPKRSYPDIRVGDEVRVTFSVVTDGARHSMVKVEREEGLPRCSTGGCGNEVYMDSDGEVLEKCFDCLISGYEYRAEAMGGDR